MITITQFSSIQLNAAKDFLAKARTNPPRAVAAAPTPAAEGTDVAAEATPPATEGDADTGAPVEAAAPVVAAAPAAKPKAGGPPSSETLAALGEQLSLDEKKVAFLVEALGVAGNRLDRVRQVRVVESEGAPSAAVKVGPTAYILDLAAEAVRKEQDRGRGGKGGKGGKGGGRGGDRDKRGGAGGPGGPRGDNRNAGGPGGPRGDNRNAGGPGKGALAPRGAKPGPGGAKPGAGAGGARPNPGAAKRS